MGKGNSYHQESWGTQLALSEDAMANQNYLDVIALSTQSLNKLMETHVLKLLELRATAYEKRGLLSRALEDAKRMIQYVPTSPAGYLSAGSVHLVNGKPSLAADCYNEALNVISKNHAQYQQIQNECIKAKQRAQQRFDIVGNLPREIVHKILINLEQERVWVCLNVSKRWCQQVSRCGTWWNSVTVKQMGTEIDQAVCDAIPLVKDYIQKLEFTDLSADLNRKYLMYFKYGIFKGLKELTLKGAFFKDVVSEDFAIALWQLRGTLTSLNVDFESGKAFPLPMVLGSCPDITELCYTTSGDISVWNGGAGYGSGCRKLSSLELQYGNTTYSALCSHLTACPNLRRLVLKSSSTQALGDPASNALTKYCPKLKILGLNSTEGLPDLDDFEHSAIVNGIEYMAVEFNHHFIFTHSMEHINAQAHILRCLRIIQTKQWQQPRNPPYTTCKTAFLYGSLSTLSYKSQTSHTRTFALHFGARAPTMPPLEQQYVGTIIQKSPNLANLSLAGVSWSGSHIRAQLEQAARANLQVLTLNSTIFQNANTDWYRSLFSSFNRVHTLILQEITLVAGVLPSLAASQSIQHLTIAKCGTIVSKELTDFFREVALRPSHRLRTFDISDMTAQMEISAIQHLIRIKSLTTLRIRSVLAINTDSVRHLIDYASSSSLKTIEILNCFTALNIMFWLSSIDRLKKGGIVCRIE